MKKHININHGLLLEVDGSLPPIFAKSETIGNIKIIISHHLYIFERYDFSPNLEDVPQKISLPRPSEVFNNFGWKFKMNALRDLKLGQKLPPIKI